MVYYRSVNTNNGVSMININQNILSFEEIAAIAEQSEQTALLLRHSYRESLVNGNHDPSLTAAGWEYAAECGKLLKGLHNVCFGASPRKRTSETIEAIIKGGGFPASTVAPYPILHDTAMFTAPENLAAAIEGGNIPALLKEYFSTGRAPGMKHIKDFVPELLAFLTGHFPCPNVIMSTHDIVVVALLSFLNVYTFTPNDWCGYVQGAFLYKENGLWTITYTVPDLTRRLPCPLFV